MFTFIIGLGKKNVLLFVGVIFFSLMATVFEVLFPYILSYYIDTFLVAKNYNILPFFIAFVVVTCILSIFCMFGSEFVSAKLVFKQQMNCYKTILKHLIKSYSLAVNKYDKGYLAKRIYSDSEQLIVFVVGCIVDLIINGIYFIGTILFISSIGWFWVTSFLVIIALYALLFYKLKSKLKTISQNLQEQESVFFSVISSCVSYLKQIKIHNLQEKFDVIFEKTQNSFLSVIIAHIKYRFFFSRSKNILNYFISTFLFISVGYCISGHEPLSVGEFVALNGYFVLGMMSVGFFFNLGTQYLVAKACFERIIELLHLPEDESGTAKPKLIKPFSMQLKDISFRYYDKKIFDNFNFTFKFGNIYSITGENGKGKSTLLNIILGILKIDSGTITVGNHNLNNLDLNYYREYYISYMEQDPFIMPTSVRDNIELFKNCNSYNNELLTQLIAEMIPENLLNKEIGYNLDDCLSGGEKQKITFARTVSKNVPLIILDEPTASIDTKTKRIFVKTLHKISEDKIIILISHDQDFIEQLQSINIKL